MRTIFRRGLGRGGWHCFAAVVLGLALAMLVPVTASGADPSSSPGRSEGDKWTRWWKLGQHRTDNASRGDITVSTPSVGGDDALLFDGGKLFEKDVRVGNFALGHPQIVPSRRKFGMWSEFDRRSANTNNAFWQVSDGLRYGVDGKIGVRLFGGNVPDNEAIYRPGELWIYGSGFRINGDGALSEGPNVRAEWRFDGVIDELPGSRLMLEGELSNDQIRDGKWKFGLRLRIPFGGPTDDRSVSYASL